MKLRKVETEKRGDLTVTVNQYTTIKEKKIDRAAAASSRSSSS